MQHTLFTDMVGNIFFFSLTGGRYGIAIMEDSMDFSQKLKIELPYDLAISLLDLGYLSKENENKNSEKKLKSKKPMIIAALFTTTKIWKQPTCLSLYEYIK